MEKVNTNTLLRILLLNSKQDLLISEKRLLQIEENHIMNTNNDFYYKENYIKIDNTNLKADIVAKMIRDEFSLV